MNMAVMLKRMTKTNRPPVGLPLSKFQRRRQSVRQYKKDTRGNGVLNPAGIRILTVITEFVSIP